jgi:hypothetical protein
MVYMLIGQEVVINVTENASLPLRIEALVPALIDGMLSLLPYCPIITKSMSVGM